MKVAGIDGCPGNRWVVVTAAGLFETTFTAEVVGGLEHVIAQVRSGELQAVAIDMPIGLLEGRLRTSDREARKRLGPRRSSVFPTPVRSVLGSESYDEACKRSRASVGRAISKQTFHLLERIEYLDDLICPADQDQVVEAHPELAFARLNGAAVPHYKGTSDGRIARRALLEKAFPNSSIDQWLSEAQAPLVDLLDATVLARTARRLIFNTEVRLGEEVDETGKRCEVVY